MTVAGLEVIPLTAGAEDDDEAGVVDVKGDAVGGGETAGELVGK